MCSFFFLGKNIIDHTNEQQKALEKQRAEISERKRRTIEMKQELEKKEESTEEIRGMEKLLFILPHAWNSNRRLLDYQTQ